MDVEETILLFAVSCFYFETVKLYSERVGLALCHDCSVPCGVPEGQQQPCSSAPGAGLSRFSLISQLSSGAETQH